MCWIAQVLDAARCGPAGPVTALAAGAPAMIRLTTRPAAPRATAAAGNEAEARPGIERCPVMAAERPLPIWLPSVRGLGLAFGAPRVPGS